MFFWKRRPRPLPQRSGEDLARAMYARLATEVRDVQRVTAGHCAAIQRTGLGMERTTSIEDCIYLYLLIRYFARKSVFEIGTFIGTTAVAMNQAVRKNAGNCTTTDPKDYGCLPRDSGIRMIEGPAEFGLGLLHREGRVVDFAFGDWYFKQPTIDLAAKTFTPDCVIAVHDYFPDDKGEENVVKLSETYCQRRMGTWLLPTGAPWRMPDGMTINACTAVFIPDSLRVTAESGGVA